MAIDNKKLIDDIDREFDEDKEKTEVTIDVSKYQMEAYHYYQRPIASWDYKCNREGLSSDVESVYEEL